VNGHRSALARTQPRLGFERAAALALGLAADALLADPARFHPVAGLGQLAGLVEQRLYQPRRRNGVAHLAAVAVPVTVLTAVVENLAGRLLPGRWGSFALTAAAAWTAIGAAGLRREAVGISRRLALGDVDGARALMPRLVGRDPALLDGAGMARAAIESVAENTADAAVGPLLWGALCGPAGVVAYRVINTLDAMVGHRSERYERFGYAAARLDDLAGLVPARLTAGLAVALAPRVDGDRRTAWRAWRRDAAGHPSPNAGPCEAAFAGALGVRLGGPTVYAYGSSQRPWLNAANEPVDPKPVDVVRAARLSRDVTAAAAAVSAGAAIGLGAVRRAFRRTR
jgi:adenosylcobinamide-phosphate synthase